MSILSWILKPRFDYPGVYRIRNTATGRDYIGATTRPISARWRQHVGNLNCDRHKNRLLQSDWKQYGAAAFEFSVIEVVRNPDLVFERERYWQDKDYDRALRYNPQNGLVQGTYTAQGAHDSGLSVLLPPGVSIEQMIEYLKTHILTDDEAEVFLSRFYRNENRLFPDEEIRKILRPRKP